MSKTLNSIVHRHFSNTSFQRKASRLSTSAVLAVAVAFASFSTPAFAIDKQLQAQLQELQEAIARLQQANDERMGALKELVQQNVDSVNRMSVSVDTLQKQMQAQQEQQSTRTDQVSSQIQSLNDSLDEVKARLGRLEKLTQTVQSQQQSMSASLQSLPQSGTTATSDPMAMPVDTAPVAPTKPGKKPGKPSPNIASDTPLAALPDTPPTAEAAAPPVDELYKTALGDYMTAKYALAATEFGDVAKYYPSNSLAGNAYYYQAEIDYRNAKYTNAVRNYDKVIEQYPDNNKVPVSHLHKGQALIAMKQTDAGVRELRTLIQRFPNSPEAMSARSKLNGMGVTPTPKKPATP